VSRDGDGVPNCFHPEGTAVKDSNTPWTAMEPLPRDSSPVTKVRARIVASLAKRMRSHLSFEGDKRKLY
jgi:hypothetical protein